MDQQPKGYGPNKNGTYNLNNNAALEGTRALNTKPDPRGIKDVRGFGGLNSNKGNVKGVLGKGFGGADNYAYGYGSGFGNGYGVGSYGGPSKVAGVSKVASISKVAKAKVGGSAPHAGVYGGPFRSSGKFGLGYGKGSNGFRGYGAKPAYGYGNKVGYGVAKAPYGTKPYGAAPLRKHLGGYNAKPFGGRYNAGPYNAGPYNAGPYNAAPYGKAPIAAYKAPVSAYKAPVYKAPIHKAKPALKQTYGKPAYNAAPYGKPVYNAGPYGKPAAASYKRPSPVYGN
jgi:hypothetical protein